MKKAVTIELEFKKWMKLALLALLFLGLSYCSMTQVNAQICSIPSGSNITSGSGSITSTTACLATVPCGGTATKKKDEDPSFKQIWFGFLSFAFLTAAGIATLGAFLTWNYED